MCLIHPLNLNISSFIRFCANSHSSFILSSIRSFILTLSIFIIFSFITEISRLQGGGVFYGDDVKFLDVYREKCTRATIRVLVPLREHPKVQCTMYCRNTIVLYREKCTSATIEILQVPLREHSKVLCTVYCRHTIVLYRGKCTRANIGIL